LILQDSATFQEVNVMQHGVELHPLLATGEAACGHTESCTCIMSQKATKSMTIQLCLVSNALQWYKKYQKVTKVHYLHNILPIYSNESMGFALKNLWVMREYGVQGWC